MHTMIKLLKVLLDFRWVYRFSRADWLRVVPAYELFTISDFTVIGIIHQWYFRDAMDSVK